MFKGEAAHAYFGEGGGACSHAELFFRSCEEGLPEAFFVVVFMVY